MHATDPSPEGPLAGRVVALPEGRQADLLAAMVERAGGTPWRCPLVSIRDVEDPAPVRAWLHRAAAGRMDVLVLITGEGLRRLDRFAGPAGLREPWRAALGRMRKITRGPKPVQALRELGLRAELTAETPTTAGVIATLEQEPLAGRVVGVQLAGQRPNAPLQAFLEEAGATMDPVAPYRYASGTEDERVVALLEALAAGRIDAIAFTSAPQVERLAQVAQAHRRREQLRAGLERAFVAAVGPVVAEALGRLGRRPDTVPEGTYFMKPLVRALGEGLG